MSLKDYIENLSPELQEKARACGSVDELLALAKEAEVPLPDEALAAIAGGDDPEAGGCKDPVKCPKCGSTDIDIEPYGIHMTYYRCKKCGYDWFI